MKPCNQKHGAGFPPSASRRRNRERLLKVCGMKYPVNISKLATLKPDYLGFIFYPHSPRYFDGNIPIISESIKKAGVFVDASLEDVIEKIKKYDLQTVQLHGSESPGFCNALRQAKLQIEIIKVFSVQYSFDFEQLDPFEAVCDYYLFDTKGKKPGGNGYTFNWQVLENYPSTKPYFLSGGIGLEELEKLKTFFNSGASKYCEVIDVNSKFEKEPGLKDVEKLEKFKSKLA